MPIYRVAAYFGLVLLLTAPFWVLGAAMHVELLPGLPIAALAVIAPALAAGILISLDGGLPRLGAFLRQAGDLHHARRWLIVAAIINPLFFGAAFAASRLSGADIPDPALSAGAALALFALFLPAAVLEELGWSGYALVGLQQRLRPAYAALLVGLFWALWHMPALVQVGRSAEWIAWWCLWTVSARFVMAWLYNWAGASLPAVVLYHAVSNVCWQLYPVNGSHFDPRVSGLITLGAALLLVFSKTMTPAKASGLPPAAGV